MVWGGELMNKIWKVDIGFFAIVSLRLAFVWIVHGWRCVVYELLGIAFGFACVNSFPKNLVCLFGDDRVVVETINDIEWESHQAKTYGKPWLAFWIVCKGNCTLLKVVFVRMVYKLGDTVKKLVG